jgi:hypothetical protein
MLLLATCCTIAALAAPTAMPYPRWEPLTDDPRQPVEVDRTRIVRDRGLVQVWIRLRADPEAVAREFEAAGLGEDDVRRVRATLHHSVHRWSFHCDESSHALALSAYYASDGSLIREFRPARHAYWPVQPDSVGQRLLGLACGGGPHAGEAGDAPTAVGEPPPGDDASGRATPPRTH